ncbi:GNAT family N-acetyltransferase [Pseudotenacibaculum haliotis]|uniref:GNAT family N-acetyltransferase n=1 Tax=Pseudotenacibaculum haliotis TaxID=1862138 RepID=A0ABW5LXA0_9FLAO
MNTQIIFETERLIVRRLQVGDLEPFHEMQASYNVMRFVRPTAMTREENEKELPDLIRKYDEKDNEFWIYAIERKSDNAFIGTCALVKDDNRDDEIGYRFLQKYWGMGYGYEVCEGLIGYCKSISMPKLIGFVADENIASAKILQKCNFKEVGKHIDPQLNIPETKYELVL